MHTNFVAIFRYVAALNLSYIIEYPKLERKVTVNLYSTKPD